MWLYRNIISNTLCINLLENMMIKYCPRDFQISIRQYRPYYWYTLQFILYLVILRDRRKLHQAYDIILDYRINSITLYYNKKQSSNQVVKNELTSRSNQLVFTHQSIYRDTKHTDYRMFPSIFFFESNISSILFKNESYHLSLTLSSPPFDSLPPSSPAPLSSPISPCSVWWYISIE